MNKTFWLQAAIQWGWSEGLYHPWFKIIRNIRSRNSILLDRIAASRWSLPNYKETFVSQVDSSASVSWVSLSLWIGPLSSVPSILLGHLVTMLPLSTLDYCGFFPTHFHHAGWRCIWSTVHVLLRKKWRHVAWRKYLILALFNHSAHLRVHS